MPQRVDIPLQRNETYAPVWVFEWPDTGGRIDLTGCTIRFQVREKLDDSGDPIASATCDISDPAKGEVEVTLAGSAFASVGDGIATLNLPYDATITDPDGITAAIMTGVIILSRGVSHA